MMIIKQTGFLALGVNERRIMFINSVRSLCSLSCRAICECRLGKKVLCDNRQASCIALCFQDCLLSLWVDFKY